MRKTPVTKQELRTREVVKSKAKIANGRAAPARPVRYGPLINWARAAAPAVPAFSISSREREARKSSSPCQRQTAMRCRLAVEFVRYLNRQVRGLRDMHYVLPHDLSRTDEARLQSLMPRQPISPIDRLILSQAAAQHAKRRGGAPVKIDFRKLKQKGVDPKMIARVKRAEKRLEK